MKVIARPVGTGKTKELLNEAKDRNGIVLTLNKRALMTKAHGYGITGLEIIDLNDLIYGNYDRAKPLYVNKLEDVMKEYFKSDFDLEMMGYSVALEE